MIPSIAAITTYPQQVIVTIHFMTFRTMCIARITSQQRVIFNYSPTPFSCFWTASYPVVYLLCFLMPLPTADFLTVFSSYVVHYLCCSSPLTSFSAVFCLFLLLFLLQQFLFFLFMFPFQSFGVFDCLFFSLLHLFSLQLLQYFYVSNNPCLTVECCTFLMF